MIDFLICLFITILIHEFGHYITAKLCGVKVDVFSIGFGKAIVKKKIGDTEFRLSWIPFGGYCKLKGEETKDPDGFLAQPYHKKVLILIAGATMNVALALIVYLIQFGDIKLGLLIDWITMKATITRDYTYLMHLHYQFENLNLFLWQLSLLNVFCGLTNLFPIPALDGGWIWMVLLEKPLGKKFLPVLKLVNGISFVLLMFLQFILVYWFLFA